MRDTVTAVVPTFLHLEIKSSLSTKSSVWVIVVTRVALIGIAKETQLI